MRRAETLPADRAATVARVRIPGVRRIALPAAGRKLLMGTISIGFALLLWHLSVGTLFNPALVPTPEQTLGKAWRMMLTGELFMHIAVSMRRVLVGYVVGCVVGIAVGALIGRVRIVRELADPMLELIRPISPVAIVPLAMLWFGIGELSKFFVIIYATVIIVLLNTAAGVSRTPVTRIRAARCLGASEYEVFIKIILPSAVPYVLTGMRVALGFSFMGIVAAELIGASEGLGFLIMNSQMLLQTDQLFVGLLSLGIVGLIVDRIFRAVLARSMRRYMQFLGDV
ncbi:MAG TPA: ABC transporter permease [Casimicrobiaceae bacterium]|nr:ABC transporter permease [Casimicrobiaceae bacterium]